ncbi:uncharacterized protein LOC123699726 [Colias croceus]|uniref:uncharacterized protein LOC123699726 n=1 Tax=Colias crocea TaxID=72248 RepID=UPI001E27E471|nr:uncharacterized protein LOC123699726 [Colias croceus]
MKTFKATIFVGLLFCISGINCNVLSSFLKPYVYKFGEDSGNVVQILEGSILPLQHQTYKDIKIPDGMDVSYIEVRVHSFSPPKVDYDSSNQQVSIAFSYTQVSVSTFKITVKAVPNVDHIEEKSMKKL